MATTQINDVNTHTNSSFTEGQSTSRPPLFNGINYNYWSTRMRIYMLSSGFDIWNIIQREYTTPTGEYSTWSNTQKLDATSNAKAMNILFCALDRNEFNRVSMFTSGYEIWRTLKVSHEGTNKVKLSKISMLKNQFENFKMRPNESINDMYSRFQDIYHALLSLEQKFTDFDVVTKILNSLTDEWERKVLSIEEASDLSTLKPEELIGNLMSYEVNLQAKRNGTQEKKNVAFQAEKDDSNSDNEDMAMIAKNFKKFLKFNRNKFKGNKNNFNNNSNSSKPSSSAMECYECHKKGHMQKDCPERKKNNFKKDKTKRKAFSVTWDDTDSSSSSESESDNEQANVCFMAKDNEFSDFTYE